ncbi:hypothetical protein RAMDARK_0510 [Rickettsia amblyommatis str. Darkwater]|nr:hypothetical protein RAMDARK_0510 [Rickettsia amblyommatis str. Darkwater]
MQRVASLKKLLIGLKRMFREVARVGPENAFSVIPASVGMT